MILMANKKKIATFTKEQVEKENTIDYKADEDFYESCKKLMPKLEDAVTKAAWASHRHPILSVMLTTTKLQIDDFMKKYEDVVEYEKSIEKAQEEAEAEAEAEAKAEEEEKRKRKVISVHPSQVSFFTGERKEEKETDKKQDPNRPRSH